MRFLTHSPERAPACDLSARARVRITTPRVAAAALAASLLAASALHAQTLTGLQLDRATVKVGEPVHATASLTHGDAINCGLRISWGDGKGDDHKITEAGHIPLKSSHAYAQPGDYTVVVEPKKVTSHLGCIGKKQTAVVKVAAAAPPPPPPAAPAPAPAPAAVPPASAKAAPPAGLQCPSGWTLNAKSVNKKSGAFTCTAKGGTPVAGDKVSCPGELTYFENVKKGQLGCRP
jgi:hypothetical protein